MWPFSAPHEETNISFPKGVVYHESYRPKLWTFSTTQISSPGKRPCSLAKIRSDTILSLQYSSIICLICYTSCTSSPSALSPATATTCFLLSLTRHAQCSQSNNWRNSLPGTQFANKMSTDTTQLIVDKWGTFLFSIRTTISSYVSFLGAKQQITPEQNGAGMNNKRNYID